MTPIFILLTGTALSAFALGVGIGWCASRNRVRQAEADALGLLFARQIELSPENRFRAGGAL